MFTVLRDSSSNVRVAKCDCTLNPETCTSQSIRGYPTIKFYRGSDNVDFTGPRTKSDVLAWAFQNERSKLLKNVADKPFSSSTKAGKAKGPIKNDRRPTKKNVAAKTVSGSRGKKAPGTPVVPVAEHRGAHTQNKGDNTEDLTLESWIQLSLPEMLLQFPELLKVRFDLFVSHARLFCFVLFCFVLFCFVLFCFVLLCFVVLDTTHTLTTVFAATITFTIFCFHKIFIQSYPLPAAFVFFSCGIVHGILIGAAMLLQRT
jgi:Thioredoxin